MAGKKDKQTIHADEVGAVPTELLEPVPTLSDATPPSPEAVSPGPAAASGVVIDVRDDTGLTPDEHFKLYGSYDKLPETHPRVIAHRRRQAEAIEQHELAEARKREEQAQQLKLEEEQRVKDDMEREHKKKLADLERERTHQAQLATQFAELNALALNAFNRNATGTTTDPRPVLAIMPLDAFAGKKCDARFADGSWCCTPEPGQRRKYLQQFAPVGIAGFLQTPIRFELTPYIKSRLMRIASLFDGVYVAWETDWDGVDGQPCVIGVRGDRVYLLACGDVAWIKGMVIVQADKEIPDILPMG